MSDDRKQGIHIGLNIGTILTTVMAGVFMLGITQYQSNSLEIPKLVTQNESISKNLDRMDDSLHEFNAFIHHHNKERTQWAIWKTKINMAIKDHEDKHFQTNFKIMGIDSLCEQNAEGIEKCRIRYNNKKDK